MSDQDEIKKKKMKEYRHAGITLEDMVCGIVERDDQITQLTER